LPTGTKAALPIVLEDLAALVGLPSPATTSGMDSSGIILVAVYSAFHPVSPATFREEAERSRTAVDHGGIDEAFNEGFGKVGRRKGDLCLISVAATHKADLTCAAAGGNRHDKHLAHVGLSSKWDSEQRCSVRLSLASLPHTSTCPYPRRMGCTLASVALGGNLICTKREREDMATQLLYAPS